MNNNKMSLNPYINFSGRAREAMEFYQTAFGGELTLLAFNPEGAPKPAAEGDTIMHSYLEADGIMLMATDGMQGQPKAVGDNMSIALSGTDSEHLHKIFNTLSEGGKIDKPFEKESWGDEFGMVTDKFDIQWMVNISDKA
jgi:PhnB protein